MNEPEFKMWRIRNRAAMVSGVVVQAVGLVQHWVGNPYGYPLVVIGTLCGMTFYLRYVVTRRWHEADALNALLDEYHEIKGTNDALLLARAEAKVKLAKHMRRHLRRDIQIATLLTRRFAFPVLNRYAQDYRHALVGPIIQMIEEEIIPEREVINLLDEPTALADVLHDHLGKNPDLKRFTPRLIATCQDHWPDPSDVAA